MIDQSHSGNSGAPLKALLALVIIWAGGRIFWEATIFAPAMVSNGSTVIVESRIPQPEIRSRDGVWTFLSALVVTQTEPKTLLASLPERQIFHGQENRL